MHQRGLVAVFDDDIFTDAPGLPAPYRGLIDALHHAGNLDICGGKKSYRKINQRLQRGTRAAQGLPTDARIANNERKSQKVLVMERTLGNQSVLAQEMSMIGREYDQRLIGNV